MCTIIIFAIIFCFLFGFYDYKCSPHYSRDILGMSIIGLLFGVCVGFLVASFIPADLEIKETKQYLQTLNDDSSISGSFFLGSGSINETMKYAYYSKDNNQFQLNLVDYNKAKIEYTNEEPVVIRFTQVYSDAFINHFTIRCGKYWYLFKIPEGSISNNYSLDAR